MTDKSDLEDETNENMDKIYDEGVSIAHLIMEGRKASEALSLVTLVTGLVFRTLLDPEKYHKNLDIHYEVLKNAPEDTPFFVGEKGDMDTLQ